MRRPSCRPRRRAAWAPWRARRSHPSSSGHELDRVRPGVDGVLPAAGCGPAQEAGLGLAEVPAGGVLGLVVAAAQRVEVAFAGPAALVERDRPLAGRSA